MTEDGSVMRRCNVRQVLKKTACDLTVLYVEDDSQTRDLFKRFLTGIFKETTVAVNGREALDLYKNASFDLVLTDIDMPVLDGLDLIKEIRKLDEEQVVIVCSASYGNERLMLELLNQSVDGFVAKPVEYDKVCDILIRVCKNIRRRKLWMDNDNGYEMAKRNRLSALLGVSLRQDGENQELRDRLLELETVYTKAFATTGANAQYYISKLGTAFIQYGSELIRYKVFNETGTVILELGQIIIEECKTVENMSDEIKLYLDKFCSLLRSFVIEIEKQDDGMPKSLNGSIVSEAGNIMTRIVLF